MAVLLASCTSPAPGRFVPSSPVSTASFTPTSRVLDSCDDPHPLGVNGQKRHDWMLCGDGHWRCWYCDVVKR